VDNLAAQLDSLIRHSRAAGVSGLLNDIGAVSALCGQTESALVHLSCARLLDPANEDVRDNLDALIGNSAVVDALAAAPHLAGPAAAPGPDPAGPVAVDPETVPGFGSVRSWLDSIEQPGTVPTTTEHVLSEQILDEQAEQPAPFEQPVAAAEAMGAADPDAAVRRAPRATPPEPPFAGHYHEWRRKRIRAIVRRYGADWFDGARVLELGCGFGDIGAALTTLGADVTLAEGRPEHVSVIADRYPGLPADRLAVYDAEGPWPFTDRFDLVVNMGLVYHVDNWQRSIIGSLRSADRVVLETEVCDSDDPYLVVKTVEEGPDQSLSGVGSRPSAAAVEHLLRTEGFRFERVADNRCNAAFHRYDWPVRNTGGWEHGLRRFWFCWRDGSVTPR